MLSIYEYMTDFAFTSAIDTIIREKGKEMNIFLPFAIKEKENKKHEFTTNRFY